MKKSLAKIFITLPLFVFCSMLTAQNNSAAEQLLQLKEGVLLVKLYTSSNAIKAMKNRGLDKRAENLEKEQKFENMAIASAFELNYNFTPKVYFFYSDDSRKILERNFDGVLMGYDLQPLNKVQIEDSAFFVAEFGHTEGQNMSALVVRDDSLNFMQDPFPYFVRTFEDFLFFERPYPKVVAIWNDKLLRKYDKYFLTPEELEELKELKK